MLFLFSLAREVRIWVSFILPGSQQHPQSRRVFRTDHGRQFHYRTRVMLRIMGVSAGRSPSTASASPGGQERSRWPSFAPAHAQHLSPIARKRSLMDRARMSSDERLVHSLTWRSQNKYVLHLRQKKKKKHRGFVWIMDWREIFFFFLNLENCSKSRYQGEFRISF